MSDKNIESEDGVSDLGNMFIHWLFVTGFVVAGLLVAFVIVVFRIGPWILSGYD